MSKRVKPNETESEMGDNMDTGSRSQRDYVSIKQTKQLAPGQIYVYGRSGYTRRRSYSRGGYRKTYGRRYYSRGGYRKTYGRRYSRYSKRGNYRAKYSQSRSRYLKKIYIKPKKTYWNIPKDSKFRVKQSTDGTKLMSFAETPEINEWPLGLGNCKIVWNDNGRKVIKYKAASMSKISNVPVIFAGNILSAISAYYNLKVTEQEAGESKTKISWPYEGGAFGKVERMAIEKSTNTVYVKFK